MNRAEFLFKALDKVLHLSQNYKKFPNVTVEKDIGYNEEFSDHCKLDLHYKKGLEGKYPVMFNIHGGGFVAGDKKHRLSFCNYMADNGWFVVNINYRLGPKFSFPAGIIDTINALNFLETIKEEYSLDLNKIVLTGDSAGAYYATHTVAVLNNNELREKLNAPDFNYKIAGLLSFCGPYDIEVAINKKMPLGFTKSIGESFIGITLNEDLSNIKDYEYLDYLAPVNFVNENWCPCFIVYSDKDIFCSGMAEGLIEKLNEKEIPLETYHTTKLADNHCFHLNWFTKESKKCFEKAIPWLEEIKAK